jgi:hypothetical protein
MRMPGYYRAAEMKEGKIVEYSFANATELDAWVAKRRQGND